MPLLRDLRAWLLPLSFRLGSIYLSVLWACIIRGSILCIHMEMRRQQKVLSATIWELNYLLKMHYIMLRRLLHTELGFCFCRDHGILGNLLQKELSEFLI